MLFLLPPSETKRIGGTLPSISQVSQTFGALADKRAELVDQLVMLSKDAELAKRVLKLGPKQLDDIEHNLALWNAPTMPALQRYEGTLFEAIDYETLGDSAKLRARETVLIQSALFGLICASDRIPKYRLSAGTVLPQVNLRQHWATAHSAVFTRLKTAAPIIDLRSKSYAALAPINSDIESYWLEVVTVDGSGTEKALNHFNKKSKGLLIRAVLESRTEPQNLKELGRIAAGIGFELRTAGDQLRLVIPGN